MGWGPMFSPSKNRLGGSLNLPNIYVYTQAARTPVGGYQNLSQFAQQSIARQQYETKYKGDPRLAQFTYGEVEAALGELAQAVSQWYPILQASQGSGNEPQYFPLKKAYIDKNPRIIRMVGGEALYGQHGGLNSPKFKVSEQLGIIKSNTSLGQGNGDFWDVFVDILETEINKQGPIIADFKRKLDWQAHAAQNVDRAAATAWGKLTGSYGGVQLKPGTNPFQTMG